MRRFGFSGRNLSGRGAHCVQMELFGIAQAAILAHAAAPTVGVGGINPWRLWGALPRRAFPRKISKIQTKSPMHKKCSKSFSRPRFGGRAAMHTEMAPTSSRAQGKGEPNVAASDAKCVTGTGTRSFTAAIGGDCGHEWTCSL